MFRVVGGISRNRNRLGDLRMYEVSMAAFSTAIDKSSFLQVGN
jgi:hypothetical protein